MSRSSWGDDVYLAGANTVHVRNPLTGRNPWGQKKSNKQKQQKINLIKSINFANIWNTIKGTYRKKNATEEEMREAQEFFKKNLLITDIKEKTNEKKWNTADKE